MSDTLAYKAKASTGMKNIFNNRERTIYQGMIIMDFYAPNNKAANTSSKQSRFLYFT